MKKLVVGMFALVMCAGMAIAHINYTICSYNGCSEIISTERVDVKKGGKLCHKCTETGNRSIGGKCQKHQDYCEVLDENAKKGNNAAKINWYDECK